MAFTPDEILGTTGSVEQDPQTKGGFAEAEDPFAHPSAQAYNSNASHNPYVKPQPPLAQPTDPPPPPAGNYTSLKPYTPPTKTLQSSGPGTGHFANFDQYFNANAAGIAKSGYALQQKVGGDVDKAKRGGDKVVNDFYTNVDSNTPAYDGGVVDLNKPSETPGPNDVINGDGTVTVNSKIPGSVGGPTPTGAPITPTSQPSAVDGPNTKRQGLEGAPQKSTAPTNAPPVFSPDEATANGGMKYDGFKALTDVQGYLDAQTGLQGARQETQALRTGSGIQGLLNEQGPGGTMDGALLNAGNGSNYANLANKFSDLDKYLSNQAPAASDYATTAAKTTDAIAGKYREMLKTAQDEKAARDADEAANGARNAKEAAALQKDKTYAQWSDPGVAGDVKGFGTALSPIDQLMHLAGQKGIIDYITNGYEGQYGHPIGDSSNSAAREAFGGMPPGWAEKVYNSLTKNELAKLNGMNPGEARAFLDQRFKALQDPNWDNGRGEKGRFD